MHRRTFRTSDLTDALRDLPLEEDEEDARRKARRKAIYKNLLRRKGCSGGGDD